MTTYISLCSLLLYSVLMGNLSQRILCLFAPMPAAANAWGLFYYSWEQGHGPMRMSVCLRAPDKLARQAWRWRCELSCALAFVSASAILPVPRLAAGLIFSWFLLTLSWIDYHMMLLPNRLTLPLCVCGLLGALSSRAFPHLIWAATFYDCLLGAVFGGGVFWLVNALFYQARGCAGMGGGDIKLMSALGAWLGWQVLPLLCCLAALFGLAWSLMRGKDNDIVPFGPCLALAGWLTYLGIF